MINSFHHLDHVFSLLQASLFIPAGTLKPGIIFSPSHKGLSPVRISKRRRTFFFSGSSGILEDSVLNTDFSSVVVQTIFSTRCTDLIQRTYGGSKSITKRDKSTIARRVAHSARIEGNWVRAGAHKMMTKNLLADEQHVWFFVLQNSVTAEGEGLVPIFCLGWLFRAPDGIDNVGILPLESNKTRLLLHMPFTKSKAWQSCAAAVILTGVHTHPSGVWRRGLDPRWVTKGLAT